ncbi:hypothetical protein POKO110462_19700 [Pontibacter korlensis]
MHSIGHFLREGIVIEVKQEAQFWGEVRSCTDKHDTVNWLSQK